MASKEKRRFRERATCMTGFLAMGLVIAIAGLWLTRPLWRRVAPLTPPRRSANVAAYQTRVGEIDADLATATLDAESAQQLRDDAAPRLLRARSDERRGGKECVRQCMFRGSTS